jgi:hypothetical protein
MYPKAEEGGAGPAATGFPMSGGYYEAGGGATSGAFAVVQGPAPWSTGLFDCFDDPGNCKTKHEARARVLSRISIIYALRCLPDYLTNATMQVIILVYNTYMYIYVQAA